MSNQPPPPWGEQSGQGNPPTQPFPPQGQPFPPQGQQPPPGYGQQPGGVGGPPPGGQPPGYGGPPGGYGGPPGGYGGPPPGGYGGPPPGGYGGPPGFGGPGGGPQKSRTPLIVGIIAAVLVLGGIAGAVLLLGGDDDDAVVVSSETAITTPATPSATEADPTATATPVPRPTSTMPEAPPEPSTPTAEPAPPPPPPPPPAPAPAGGESMTMNERLTGTIDSSTPSIDYFFDGVAGEAIELTMIAVSPELDPTLALYGPDGALLAENDDDFDLGTATDSRIQFDLPADGQYRVEASSFGDTTGDFELTLSFPSVLSAEDTLSDSVPEITYEYDGRAGQEVVVQMRALEEGMDPLVYVLDADGNEIGRDDDSGATPLDARLSLTLPADGTYTIVASAFSERYGAYEISVTEL